MFLLPIQCQSGFPFLFAPQMLVIYFGCLKACFAGCARPTSGSPAQLAQAGRGTQSGLEEVKESKVRRLAVTRAITKGQHTKM